MGGALWPGDDGLSGCGHGPELIAGSGESSRIAREEGLAAAKRRWLADPLFAPAMARPAVAARLAAMIEDFSGWHWLHRRAGPGRTAAERVGEIKAPTLVVIGELDLPDFHRIADL